MAVKCAARGLARCLLVAAAVCGAGLLLACSMVQVSRSTRYFATESDVGKTLQLHRGDDVTLNLPISGGRDWTAGSSDPRVARPATTEVMTFTGGEKARLFDFALVGAGHAVLVACPAGTGACSPSSPGAVVFNVEVGAGG
jgi:hypothetical protein